MGAAGPSKHPSLTDSFSPAQRRAPAMPFWGTNPPGNAMATQHRITKVGRESLQHHRVQPPTQSLGSHRCTASLSAAAVVVIKHRPPSQDGIHISPCATTAEKTQHTNSSSTGWGGCLQTTLHRTHWGDSSIPTIQTPSKHRVHAKPCLTNTALKTDASLPPAVKCQFYREAC